MSKIWNIDYKDIYVYGRLRDAVISLNSILIAIMLSWSRQTNVYIDCLHSNKLRQPSLDVKKQITIAWPVFGVQEMDCKRLYSGLSCSAAVCWSEMWEADWSDLRCYIPSVVMLHQVTPWHYLFQLTQPSPVQVFHLDCLYLFWIFILLRLKWSIFVFSIWFSF